MKSNKKCNAGNECKKETTCLDNNGVLAIQHRKG